MKPMTKMDNKLLKKQPLKCSISDPLYSYNSKTADPIHKETQLKWDDKDAGIELDDSFSITEEYTESDYDDDKRCRPLSVQKIWNPEVLWNELQTILNIFVVLSVCIVCLGLSSRWFYSYKSRKGALPGAPELTDNFILNTTNANEENQNNIIKENLEKYGKTILLLSSWLGKYDVLKSVLESGVSPNVTDLQGRSALHLAAFAGHANCAEALIQYGADVNCWEAEKSVAPLHCAASMGHLECLRLLIKNGARVNEGIEKRSPLHYAVESLAVECVQELLENHAIPNTPQVYSEAPIHVAAALGNVAAITLLLKYGAAVNVQSGLEKLAPLHLASEQGYEECCRLLIKQGAQINALNRKRQTPLHLAALTQCTETLDLLLKNGANPNAPDVDGRTPLHCSTVNAQRATECVKVLLSAGADPNRQDAFGYTPMHLAALNESSSCVMLFLQYGGDVTARTNGGVSVLNFITKKTPDVVPKYISKFDNAIRLNEHDFGDVDCQLKLDFRILVPTMGNQETSLLVNFIEVGHKNVLEHPLCEAFLNLKWCTIRKFFLFSLIYHLLFVTLFTFYIISVYVKFCPSSRNIHRTNCMAENYVSYMGFMVILLNIFIVLKELFQMLHSPRRYIKEWENWLQWTIIIGVFCCVQPKPGMNIKEYVWTWQHHTAAFTIFFCWLELMMIVGRFPTFGLYVQMFTTVSVNFAKFMLTYFCLFIAFSLSFGVIFSHYKAFGDLKWIMLKVIIMMSGELEYEDIFFDSNYVVEYPYTAQIFYLIFVLLVTIILANLMVGLAVSDIQGLQKTAGLERLVRQARLISGLESLLFSKLLRWVPHKIMRFLHRRALLLKSQRDWTLDVRPNDPREDKIPKDLIRSAYELVLSKREKKSYRRSCRRFVYSPPGSRIGSIRESYRGGFKKENGSCKKDLPKMSFVEVDEESGFGTK